MKSSSESSPSQSQSSMNNAYPWLLGVSTCLSGVLCWMYVTKPVQVIAATNSAAQQEQAGAVQSASVSGTSESSNAGKASAKSTSAQLIPSDDALPGNGEAEGKGARLSESGALKKADPRKIMALGDGSGWETTNSRVQHILNADAGGGDVTKIVLNVPVLYQTRSMRWTPTDVQKARDVLTRLMIYEGNLAKIKHEGQLLLRDWNSLLEKTVPAAALRADSPSLPYNYSQSSDNGQFSGQESTIKIEQ